VYKKAASLSMKRLIIAMGFDKNFTVFSILIFSMFLARVGLPFEVPAQNFPN
jgi:hypothetical protein